jgi:YidC/Oxa1 family membrane protein insertase
MRKLNLGGTVLAFLSNAMKQMIMFFYDITGLIGIPSYGGAIILLTIALKIALYPLTVSQVKSMKAMAAVSPKLKELQEKYKNNPEKLQKEMSELYKSHKINPISGCLPLLVQMPFLFAIFLAIQGFDYPGGSQFLWFDLAQKDTTFILPVISAVATYLQSKMSITPDQQQQQQQKIMTILRPAFILYISITFPSGLVLYWAVSTIVQVIQQYYLNHKAAAVQGEAG